MKDNEDLSLLIHDINCGRPIANKNLLGISRHDGDEVDWFLKGDIARSKGQYAFL